MNTLIPRGQVAGGMKIVPDTSVVVDGRISERVESGEYAGATVYVPEAVVGEVEAEANGGQETGWDALSELQRLADLADAEEIELHYIGERATSSSRRSGRRKASTWRISNPANARSAPSKSRPTSTRAR